MDYASKTARLWSMSSEAAWSKDGSHVASVAVSVDEAIHDRHLPDPNTVRHQDQAASKAAFADEGVSETAAGLEIAVASETEAALEIEADSAAASTTEGVGFVAVEALEVTEVGTVAEEVLAIKIAAVSRMAHHRPEHPVARVPEVASVPAHNQTAAPTKTEVATATQVVIDALEEAQEVAMTPETLAASVAAIAIPLVIAGVGMVTAIDTATDLDVTTTTDQGKDITTATNPKIRDPSGGIEHHIPVEVCWWVSLSSKVRLLCLVPFSSRVRKVLHYYQRLPKHRPRRCGVTALA